MDSFGVSTVEYPEKLGWQPKGQMPETEKLKEIQGY